MGTPKESKNTLRSRATARLIDLLGEGQMEVVQGDKSVFLDKTPLEEPNGKRNFKGVRTSFRNGTKNQSYIKNFRAVENEVNVGLQLTKSGGGIVRTITDLDADAIVIKWRLDALSKTNNKNGNINPTKVRVSAYLRPNGGSWSKVADITKHGKTNSPYEFSKRIDLPSGQGPWDIRVERETDDSNNSYLRNGTYFTSYTIVYDVKLTYPYSSLVGLEFDAKLFNSVPERRYRCRRLDAPYPSNWNPTTRVYTGIWDGTFLYGVHNNPAWYIWELMTNDVFGLGDLIASTGINKWNLYTIAQYCDGLVNGKPRFTFNGVVTTQTQAIKLLDSIASVFRGMIYWSSGTVDFAQDRPGTPSVHVTAANVIDGTFHWSGSARKTRSTAVIVGWNNPKMLGDIDYLIVTRDDLAAKFGYRPKRLSAFGCTDEEQARRMGEWYLDTQEHETEFVTYQASMDHINVVPGTIAKVFDPARQGARFGGRINAVSGTLVTLDNLLTWDNTKTWNLNVVMPDGTITTRLITAHAVVGGVSRVTIASALPATPVAQAMWTIDRNDVAGEEVFVTGVFEKADNIFEVQALKRDPTKFARVERNVIIDHPDYSVYPSGQLAAPESIDITEYYVENGNGTFDIGLMVGWLASNDPRTQRYEFQWVDEGGPDLTDPTFADTVSVDLSGVEEGLFTFQVRAVCDPTLMIAPSDWCIRTVTVMGANKKPLDVQNLKVNVAGDNAVLSWSRNEDAITQRYEIRFSPKTSGATWDAGMVIADDISKNTSELSTVNRKGTFMIKARTKNGVYSNNATSVVNKTGLTGGVLAGVYTESGNWYGVNPLYLSNTVYDGFATSRWTKLNCTYSGTNPGKLSETTANGQHKISAVFSPSSPNEINSYDTFRVAAEFTPRGGRNVRIRATDLSGNSAVWTINLATRTLISQTVTGFVGPQIAITTPNAGKTTAIMSFRLGLDPTDLTVEILSMNGTTESYAGSTSAGFDVSVTYSVRSENNTVEVSGGNDLQIKQVDGEYPTRAYYFFKNTSGNININTETLLLPAQTSCRFVGKVEYQVANDPSVIGDLDSIGDTDAIGGSNEGVNVYWQVRSSPDIFTRQWSEWQYMTDAYYVGACFQFRLVITTDNPLIRPIITTCSVEWSVPTYTEQGEGLAPGAVRTTITYSKTFVQVPSVNVIARTMPSGGYIEIDNKTVNGFRVGFFNSSNTLIGRTWDWSAVGNGPAEP